MRSRPWVRQIKCNGCWNNFAAGIQARAGQLADRLIKQDGIKFILGPYGSGPTVVMAPITEKYKIPMVEGNGASRSLFNKGCRYLFAALSTSEK